jgi:DnaJ-class molecular chaperone
MNNAIRRIAEASGLLVCPSCNGEGEVDYFCGHESTETCHDCGGQGVIISLNKQKHKETCVICKGGGGPGCCNNRGFQEWESYELI